MTIKVCPHYVVNAHSIRIECALTASTPNAHWLIRFESGFSSIHLQRWFRSGLRFAQTARNEVRFALSCDWSRRSCLPVYLLATSLPDCHEYWALLGPYWALLGPYWALLGEYWALKYAYVRLCRACAWALSLSILRETLDVRVRLRAIHRKNSTASAVHGTAILCWYTRDYHVQTCMLKPLRQ